MPWNRRLLPLWSGPGSVMTRGGSRKGCLFGPWDAGCEGASAASTETPLVHAKMAKAPIRVNEFSQARIDATEAELKEERPAVHELGSI